MFSNIVQLDIEKHKRKRGSVEKFVLRIFVLSFFTCPAGKVEWRIETP